MRRARVRHFVYMEIIRGCQMETITSRENAKIKYACRLREEEKLRTADGLFFAEGPKLCLELARGCTLQTLYATEKALAHTSQDVFGVFEHPGWQAADILAKGRRILALEAVQDPGNVGTLLRSAAAFGFDGVLLSKGCAAPFAPKTLRASMGAAGRLPVAPVQDLPQALQQLRARGVVCLAAALYHSRPLDEAPQSYPDGLCAVIGSEGQGLTDAAGLRYGGAHPDDGPGGKPERRGCRQRLALALQRCIIRYGQHTVLAVAGRSAWVRLPPGGQTSGRIPGPGRTVWPGKSGPEYLSARAREFMQAVAPAQMAGLKKRCDDLNIFILTPDSADYPQRLRDLPDLPLVLYGTGNPACLNGRRYVGMVGTRRPTKYGLSACRDLSLTMAERGVVIVSGLAEGLDGAGHRAAVEAGQQTVAFLGTAINKTFPAVNVTLRTELEALGGAVLSEYPPDYTGKMTGTFLARNRLIAGLSEALCVAEARTRSGTLNTVSHAEEYGRPVFAVPGSIYSPTSEGTNELLRTGRARALCTADDVLDTLHIAPGGTELVQEGVMLDELTPNARTVLAELGPKAQTADDLAASTGLAVQAVLAALMELEFAGAAVDNGGGRYTAA